MDSDAQTIDQLLDALRRPGPKPDAELRTAIGKLGEQAVPALVAMVTDPGEYEAAEDDPDEVTGWAPYTAIELLGDLHPPQALEPLLSLIGWDDYDYLSSILPEALGKFGQSALDPLFHILADRSSAVWPRVRAGEAARASPELQDEIVARLTAQLDIDEPESEELDILHGFIVGELVQLRAKESIPSIIRAFKEGRVDPLYITWPHVRRALDVPPEVGANLDDLYPEGESPLATLASLLDTIPPLDPIDPIRDRGWAIQEPYRRETAKVGRNEPCPCGSGKKYKKCCGQ